MKLLKLLSLSYLFVVYLLYASTFFHMRVMQHTGEYLVHTQEVMHQHNAYTGDDCGFDCLHVCTRIESEKRMSVYVTNNLLDREEAVSLGKGWLAERHTLAIHSPFLSKSVGSRSLYILSDRLHFAMIATTVITT